MLRYYSIGKPTDRFNNIPTRLEKVLTYAIGQKRMFRKPSTAVHFLLFYGFLILLIPSFETYIREIYPPFRMEWVFGELYKPILLVADYIGFFVLGAVIASFYRRLVLKQVRYVSSEGLHRDMTLILYAISAHVIFAWSVHSMEIFLGVFPLPQWAPVSNSIAPIWNNVPTPVFDILYEIVWWLHVFSVLLTTIYIMSTNAYLTKLRIFPSKHFHVIGSFLSIFFQKLEPQGRLTPINFEDETLEQYGVAQIEDFQIHQLVQLTACTGCGLCQELCPAFLNDQPLSPKKLILDIREHFLEKAPILLKQRSGKELNDYEKSVLEKELIGDVISQDTIWACVTCNACQTACPVFIEHIDKIVDMRRDLSMMKAEFPEGVDKIFRNLEVNGNPWGLGKHTRADWVKELGEDLKVPTIDDNPDADYLFWVGCFGSFDDRSKKVTKAFVKILNKANVDFAILGKKEKCTGDPARRLGNEYLAQELIMENVETLNSHNIKRILTFCPHCMNTIQNEYPDFGGNYEVIHAVDFLNELLKENKIKVKPGAISSLTYHDSCYLGRHNDIYDSPREVIKEIRIEDVREMEMNKRTAMCCGAGGGRMWWEGKDGIPINKTRVEMAAKTGAETIAVSCPFCMVMLEDGLLKTDKSDKMQVQDLIEIVAHNLEE